ncbi:MAG: molybdenum cofactor biosynthesis protein MoaE, partial [Chthoniobacterales bacterium]
MEPEIAVRITSEPLPASALPKRDDCGAVVDFFGVVRGEESGESIEGLEYEAYQPMAERQIDQIIRELLTTLPCRTVDVVHRIGFIPAGEPSIAVRIAARHRQEAISFLAEF